MAFFTQAIRDRTIDKNLQMTEAELKNAIWARVVESNAFELHKKQHKDAKLVTIEEDGGFSRMEKSAGKRHEDEPKITYENNVFKMECNCGKEKFVFDIKKDTVESESTHIRMKEIEPYKKNNQRDGYGREQSESSSYDGGSGRRGNLGYNSSGYNSNQGSGMKYKN